MRLLSVIDRPGPELFSATLSLQTNVLGAKVADRDLADTLVLVEHEHVYTVGRGTSFQDTDSPRTKEIPWVEISRGGGATYHGPGQLVAYPIFDLERHGRDVHVFLRKIEEAGIYCLEKLGVHATARPGLTGIWVRQDAAGTEKWKKIASIGIGVRRWVSYHGLALNVSPDLDYFKAITPCNQDGTLMTSLEELLGQAPSMSEVREKLRDGFLEVFDLSLLHGAAVEKAQTSLKRRSRPEWLRAKAPGSPEFVETKKIVRKHKLFTVCEEARCPNMGECWAHGTATFMILGDLCTRRCSFCSVKDGTLQTLEPLDPLEPLKVGQAVSRLGLKHVVITSVNRDDLPDMGAEHYRKVIKAVSHVNPDCDIELLIPDMRGKRELVETILKDNLIKVLNHNVETVPRLYREVRPGAKFSRSLDILRWAREIAPNVRTKSGVMVGLGETKEEVLSVMDQLIEARVQVLTIGQYLQPTVEQLAIQRFVTPAEFEEYREAGLAKGFLHVESGPLVRSSYHAWKHTGDVTPSSSPNL